MRKQPILSLGKASLLMLGLSTVALMGVPGFGRYAPPEGDLVGVTLDAAGHRLPQVEVALFDDRDLSLVATTTTDEHGHFAFGIVPERFHVFASYPDDPRWTGDWALDRERAPNVAVELHLERGTPLVVRVIDFAGRPVPGSEVRLYDARLEPQVLARVESDEKGVAALSAPGPVHLYVKPSAASGLAPRWFLDLAPDAEETNLVVELSPEHEIAGTLTDEEGAPVEGAVVTAWDEFESFAGWTRSDADGAYHLVTGGETAALRFADPDRRLLPLQRSFAAGPGRDAVLAGGRSRRLRIGTPEEPIPARVWLRDEETASWSWGGLTEPDGMLRTAVGERFSVYAQPLSSPSEPLVVWDRSVREEPLQLVAEEAEEN